MHYFALIETKIKTAYNKDNKIVSYLKKKIVGAVTLK